MAEYFVEVWGEWGRAVVRVVAPQSVGAGTAFYRQVRILGLSVADFRIAGFWPAANTKRLMSLSAASPPSPAPGESATV